MSINSATISGNLTRDPECRLTASGLQIMNFTLAFNDRKRGSDGNWEEVANFIDCTLFGSRAESLELYLTKGTKVVIQGKLRWSSWEKNGEKHSKIGLIVDQLDFVSRRNRSDDADSQAQKQEPIEQAPEPAEPQYSLYDEDIPF